MGDQELFKIIQGCSDGDRNSQKMLYKAMHGYALGICLRYTANRSEAVELLNLGFATALSNLNKHETVTLFKNRLRFAIICKAIASSRANLIIAYNDTSNAVAKRAADLQMLPDLNYDELLALLQSLPQSSRLVFNLFAIDGYSHKKIAAMLDIDVAASMSKLDEARQKLAEMITERQKSLVDKRITK